MSTEASKPWDKRDNEPSLWWGRFDKFYRPQGPGRTLTQAYRLSYEEKNGRPPTRAGYSADWKNKAELWEWKERAAAWDTELHKEQIGYEKSEALEMTKRQIQDAKAIQTLAMNEIIERGFTKESTVAVARILAQAQQLEQAARAIPDNLAKIGEMNDDELKRAIAKELVRADISGSDREQWDEALGTGSAVSEADGSEQAERDSLDGPDRLSGADTVPEESGSVRDGSSEGETEKLASQVSQETSD
jgi:hypothetical protein